MVRSLVAAAMLAAVPAQAFAPGGLVPLRAGLVSPATASSPVQPGVIPSLPRRRSAAAVTMTAASAVVAPGPTKSPMSIFRKIGKVALAMVTILFLVLGSPDDADAASRKGGRSGGRMGGGFKKSVPAPSRTVPASAATSTATATSGTALGATAGAAAPAAGTTVVHHHHHGGGVGGFRAGLGMGIGHSLMNPFGFSPFGMGMGMGMFGFRPMIPLSTIFVMGAFSMACIFMFLSRK